MLGQWDLLCMLRVMLVHPGCERQVACCLVLHLRLLLQLCGLKDVLLLAGRPRGMQLVLLRLWHRESWIYRVQCLSPCLQPNLEQRIRLYSDTQAIVISRGLSNNA